MTVARIRHPSWSPDGQSIAFTSDRVGGGNYEIYVMDANGDNVRRLTDHPAEDWHPSWSSGWAIYRVHFLPR